MSGVQLRLKVQQNFYWTIMLHDHFDFCQDGIGVSILPLKTEPMEKSYQVLLFLNIDFPTN